MDFGVLSILRKSKAIFAVLALASSLQINAKSIEILDIQKAPNKQTWIAFFDSSEDLRQKLWESKKNRNLSLKDWTWEWRLAWVRVCAVSPRAYCGKILESGLQDQALVVRSETAALIGKRFEGSRHPRAIALLKKAYKNPNNYRNGRALFVQFRILNALDAIDPENRKSLYELAKSDSLSLEYLSKL